VPSLQNNTSMWGADWDWSQRGEEWSTAWGGVSHQWWTTLFPRVQGYVPAGRILEIAPGFGRWTHFLRDLCDELIAVDIAQNAIDACRERFRDDPHVSSFVGDGTSLPMVADASIDLVFSFDSLVHAESDVMFRYMDELARILSEDGVAFLHHSNLGAYPPGSYDPGNVHWRAPSVSAALVEQAANAVSLRCVSQERVAWGDSTRLLDCFSVITRAYSKWDRENVVVDNFTFGSTETEFSHRLSTLYPPSCPSVRFGDRTGASPDVARVQAQARLLLAQGEVGLARDTLGDHVRRAIDVDSLNDLAVLTNHCGDRAAAIDLLRALVRIHPEDPTAAENLRLLGAQAA
jgi:SAM-dependent methyltransferase